MLLPVTVGKMTMPISGSLAVADSISFRTRLCPSGAFIAQFKGSQTEVLQSLGAECSDGTWLVSAGDKGFSTWSTPRSSMGFRGFEAHTAAALNSVAFYEVNSGTPGETFGGPGGVAMGPVICPKGTRATGYFGSMKRGVGIEIFAEPTQVVSLGLMCGDY